MTEQSAPDVSQYWKTEPSREPGAFAANSLDELRTMLVDAKDAEERQRASIETPITVPLIAFVGVFLPLLATYFTDWISGGLLQILKIVYLALLTVLAIGAAVIARQRQRRGSVACRWILHLETEIGRRLEATPAPAPASPGVPAEAPAGWWRRLLAG